MRLNVETWFILSISGQPHQCDCNASPDSKYCITIEKLPRQMISDIHTRWAASNKSGMSLENFVREEEDVPLANRHASVGPCLQRPRSRRWRAWAWVLILNKTIKMKTRIAFNLLPIDCSAMLQSTVREKAFYPFRNLDSQRLLLGRPFGAENSQYSNLYEKAIDSNC